jgi:hypothetical protein
VLNKESAEVTQANLNQAINEIIDSLGLFWQLNLNI